MDKYKITKEDEKKRLDMFLKEKYPSFSRSFLQKKIKEGNVKVNEEIAAVHRFLKSGDVVEIRELVNWEISKGEIASSPLEGGKGGVKLVINDINQLDIISETDDYVVINKPCGLVVHPGETSPNPSFAGGGQVRTLVDILKEKYPEIEDVGEDPLRPGIVHRLDKDVSGIMVIAKKQKMFENLKKQFQDRTIDKEYIALVCGIIQKPEGVINFPIARSEQNGLKMAARPLDQGGREAITEFTVLKHLTKWTLVSLKIKTGRTHQIRVHMNAYGHPIVGDKIYKPKKLKPTLKFGSRIMLHSWKLGFKDLSGKNQKFEAELPEEFKKIV